MHISRKMALLVSIFSLVMSSGCGGDDPATPSGPAPRVPVTTQYTDGAIYTGNPSYSPNGEWILYETETAGNRDIWMLPIGDGDPVRLTTDPEFDSAPCWSADGSNVYFESERSGQKKIWVISALGDTDAERVTDTAADVIEGSVACSVNGDLVIEYASAEVLGTNIYLIPAGQTTPEALTDTGRRVTNRTPDWSPDGSQIAFESTSSGGSAIWIMDADGSNLLQLTVDPYYEGHPAWSPDGEEIAFESRRTGYMEIFVIPAAGGDPLQISVSGGYWPEYSIDGTKLVYCVFGSDESEMWVMNVDW